jgi:serine/threonine-protein kinase
MRHSLSLLAVILLLAIGGVIIAIIAESGGVPGVQVQRGTGTGKVAATPEGTKVVSVTRASPHAFDPLGDDDEHSSQAWRVADRDDSTVWTTEQYTAGIEGAGKPGVGIYVDAKPEVEAVQMQISTPEPGWKATIYALPDGPAPKEAPPGGGWTKVGGGTVNAKDKRFTLDTGGKAYRYYLVWITKLATDAERAQISEIRLFQEVAA